MSSVTNLQDEIWLLEPDEPEVSAATRKLRMLRTLRCGNKYERAARAQGANTIAGVDEVGRGALFGPVVAAAVILPPDCRIRGLRDSKQLLTPAQDRERLAVIVEKKAIAIAVEEVCSEVIDRVNIYQATRIAMTAAVTRLAPAADHLLIDAMRLDLACAQTSIIYGDSLSISIAAASVVAKVYHDRRMCELDREYPGQNMRTEQRLWNAGAFGRAPPARAIRAASPKLPPRGAVFPALGRGSACVTVSLPKRGPASFRVKNRKG